MFNRLFGSSGNNNVKQGGFFNRWFKNLKRIFKKKPKVITPSHRNTRDKLSFSNKLKKSMTRHSNNKNRKRILEEAKKKAKILKRKFSMTESQGQILDKFIAEANKGSGTDLRLANNLLDPDKLSKSRVKKLIKRYEEARRKNRGLSYMMTESNLSLIASKLKVRNLMEDMGVVSRNLTEILKKYKDI